MSRWVVERRSPNIVPRFPPCLCQWLDHKAAVLLACYLPSQPIAALASILSFNYQVPLIPVLWPTVYNIKIASCKWPWLGLTCNHINIKMDFYLRCWEKLTMVCLQKDTVSKTSICTKDGQVRLTGCVPHSLLMQPGAAFVIPARDGRAASAWGSHKQCRGVWRGAGAKQPHNLRRYNATPHFKRVQCNRAQPTVWSRCQLPRGQPSLSWTHLFVSGFNARKGSQLYQSMGGVLHQ